MSRSIRGQLIRDVPVRVLDFSWSGCLVAANQTIAPGTTGILQINMGGMESQDTVHVVRQTRHPGFSHAFTFGAQFGWGQRPSKASVRAKIPAVVTLP